VADRHESGVPDTRTCLDLARLTPDAPPSDPEFTATTMAEPHQGVAMARIAAARATRAEKLGLSAVTSWR
jgi:toxin FitB